MSTSFHSVTHPSDSRKTIRIELAPKISTLKYGPVRGECSREDVEKRQVEHMFERTEEVIMMRGVMLGNVTLEVTKMVIREIWYTEEEEVIRSRIQLVDKDDGVMGILWVREDEPQESVVMYMAYLPRSTRRA